MKTKKFLTLFAACLLSFSLSYAQVYSFSALRDLISSASGTQVISSGTLEGIVISDAGNPNVETIPNPTFNTIDLTENDKTAYIQAADGSYGLRLKFNAATTLTRYTHVMLDLIGATLTKEENPTRYTLSNLTGSAILSSSAGVAADVTVKQKTISQLTDNDVYTVVKLKDTEMALPYGSFYNARNTQYYVYHSTIPALICDTTGASIYMLHNNNAAWAHSVVPDGNGTVDGIIVNSRLKYYASGDLLGKYQIRPLSGNDILMTNPSYTQTLVEWNWFQGGNTCTSGTSSTQIPKDGNGKMLSATGTGTLWCDNGGTPSLAVGAYPICGGSNKDITYVLAQYTGTNWWNNGNPYSFICRFSTAAVTGRNLTITFAQGGGSGALTSSQIPVYWEVRYSTNGADWETLPNSTYSIRPLSGWGINMPYAYSGLTDHTFALPDSLLGKPDVYVKLIPNSDLSFDPVTAEDTYHIGSTTENESIRFGVISIKYTNPEAVLIPDFESGTGTEQDPYLIMNATQLDNVRKYLNLENPYFKLGDNIDLTAFLADKTNGWQPFGTFAANFNGNNKTISGLWIKNGGASTALFGILNAPAKIYDLTVQTTTAGVTGTGRVGILAGTVNGGEIYNCTTSGVVKGTTATDQYNYGGFAGYNDGYIHDCAVKNVTVTGNLQCGGMLGINNTNGRLKNCHVDSATIYCLAHAGGLASHNQSTTVVENCSATAINISAYGFSGTTNGHQIGGLIGQNGTSTTGGLRNCWAESTLNGNYMVGGLVGRNYKNIEKSWACAKVSAVYSTASTGGFIGRQDGGKVVNCFALASSKGQSCVGGFVGNYATNAGSIDSCYSVGSVFWSATSGNAQAGGFVGVQTGGAITASYCANPLIKLTGGSDNAVGMFNGLLNNAASTVSNSYYLPDFSIVTSTGTISAGTSAAAGLSGVDAYDKSKYAAFNFDNNTWQIREGKTTPYFAWQSVPLSISEITATGITAESKENIAAGTVITLRKDSVEIALQSNSANGKTWTGSFAGGTLTDGNIVYLVVREEGKAPAASVAKYTVSTGSAQVTASSVALYPNPASDYVTINNTAGQTIAIYSVLGRKVCETTGGNTVQIPVSGWSKGVYLVNAGGKTLKFIKE